MRAGAAVLSSFAVAPLWFATAGLAVTLANPASLYCEQRGGRVEIVAASNGAEHGICVLQDGTRIDEWAYFRNGHRTTL